MFARRFAVEVTTTAGGAATVYTGEPVNGEVLTITYVPHASTPLDTGADIVVTGEITGTAILTKANIGTSTVSWAPRQPTHKVADGAAALYASGGEAVNDRIAIAGERIKIVVAQGGNVLQGTFHVTVG